MTGRPRHAGFTLLELIAVVTIVSLLIVFVPMALDFLVAERELEREVLALGTSIEAVQAQAVVDRADYAMHYDTEKHRWAIQFPVEVERDPPRGRDGQPRGDPIRVLKLEENVPEERLDWNQLPKGVTLRLFQGNRFLSGRYRVIFGWRGTVDPHILVLESANVSSLVEEERARTVKVNFLGFPTYAPGVRAEEMRRSDAELR